MLDGDVVRERLMRMGSIDAVAQSFGVGYQTIYQHVRNAPVEWKQAFNDRRMMLRNADADFQATADLLLTHGALPKIAEMIDAGDESILKAVLGFWVKRQGGFKMRAPDILRVVDRECSENACVPMCEGDCGRDTSQQLEYNEALGKRAYEAVQNIGNDDYETMQEELGITDFLVSDWCDRYAAENNLPNRYKDAE